MPNIEKTDCAKCQGTGTADFAGFGLDTCRWCDGKGTVEQSSIVGEVAQWAADGCPEGVSGMPENVTAICATVKESLTVAERASDAITLLYTHDLLTQAMRDHARKKLANL